MGKLKDISCQKFGRLTALCRLHNTKGKTKWLCVCDCGNFKEVRVSHLISKHTNSCGCLHKENISNLFSKHHKTKTRIYTTWLSMKSRCYNKSNKDYMYYGGRGIKLCDEWCDDFQSFYDWAINNGYKDNLTIDRIDVNGNYEPNNCRWITTKQQARNRRDNKLYTINDVTRCLSEWCEIYKLKYQKVYDRLYKLGWSIERALELEN